MIRAASEIDVVPETLENHRNIGHLALPPYPKPIENSIFSEIHPIWIERRCAEVVMENIAIHEICKDNYKAKIIEHLI